MKYQRGVAAVEYLLALVTILIAGAVAYVWG